MNSAIYVLDWNEQLLERLRGRTVVVSTRSLDEMQRAREGADRFQANVHCVILHANAPLALLPLPTDGIAFPLALFTQSMGRFQDLVLLLPVLRAMNVRIYMPADLEESLTGVRILASLGIDCAITFDGSSVQWDMLTDLMTYALIGMTQHADIEPFSFIAGQYNPQSRGGFGAVYFDDPTTYLHVSADGRVALTRSEMREGRFFASSVEEVTDENRLAAWDAQRESWRRFFLERSPCAQCPGWRICGGALASSAHTAGCAQFFAELMDVIDRQRSRTKVKAIWRP